MFRRALAGFLVILLVAGTWSTASFAQPSGAPPGYRMISDHPVWAVAADGDRVLYFDAQTRELVLHDLRSWTRRLLPISRGMVAQPVALSGSYAAYVLAPPNADKEGGGTSTLTLYDLRSGRTVELEKGEVFLGPLMAGGKLVWGKPDPWKNAQIYAYDLATSARQDLGKITVQYYDQLPSLAYDGRFLAWAQGPNIMALDTETGKQYHHPTYMLQHVAGVDQGRVLYITATSTEPADGGQNIFTWDVPSDTEKFVMGVRRQTYPPFSFPAIRGNKIAASSRGQTNPVFVVDLGSDRSVRVVDDTTVKGAILLTRRYVVYQTRTESETFPRLAAVPFIFLPERALIPRGDGRAPRFSDLSPDHWAFGETQLVLEAGLMKGYPDGSFRPENGITRAEFLAILMRAYSRSGPTGDPFEDVPESHWAYKLIGQAREFGLVTGSQNRFRPDDLITRAEMAVMLQRFLQLPDTGESTAFPDITPEFSWAQSAIEILASYGLLTGFPDGRFRPIETATRAQSAALISRLFQR